MAMIIPFPDRERSNEADEVGNVDERADRLPETNAYVPQLEGTVSEEQWRRDADELSTTALAKKYPLTFSSFKGMKNRERAGSAKVHEDFSTFKDFFGHLGPRRRIEDTLDRIDHKNPLYAPELVRWADKKTQARNRTTTVFLADPKTGEVRTAVEWAEILDVNAATLRRRKIDGWTDAEALAGHRFGRTAVGTGGRWPWADPPKNMGQWEADYLRYRQKVSENEMEFRHEFAIRRLKAESRQHGSRLVEIVEAHGGPGEKIPESLPPEVRELYDTTIATQSKIEARLKEALEFAEDTQAQIESWKRPTSATKT